MNFFKGRKKRDFGVFPKIPYFSYTTTTEGELDAGSTEGPVPGKRRLGCLTETEGEIPDQRRVRCSIDRGSGARPKEAETPYRKRVRCPTIGESDARSTKGSGARPKEAETRG